MIRFAALDFETANARPDSACALGVAVFDEGRLTAERHWFIRPPDESGPFHPFNTRLHGISAADVADAPDFARVWTEAAPLVGDRLLVAHNAAFDMGLLRTLFSRFEIEEAPRGYLCSYLLARRVWPHRPSYSLGLLAADLGIVFRHHDALEDARACGQVVVAACKAYDYHSCDCGLHPQSLEDLAHGVGIRLGRVGVYPCASTLDVRRRPAREAWPEPVPGADGVFRGKTVVFTGTLGGMTRRAAARLVADQGGLVSDTLDAGVDFLVEGAADPSRLHGHAQSAKSRKAAELLAAGAPIEIIEEADFLEMVSGSGPAPL